MKTRLGDTIEFDYSAPKIHDKHPKIFFLAKVGSLVHGLNQHYQTPQEKSYYYLLLKKLLADIKAGKISAQDFYSRYVRDRLVTDSYRTYKTAHMSSISRSPSSVFSQKVDIKPSKSTYQIFQKGDKVRFVSMVRGKLSWKNGTVLGRKTPGLKYVIELDDGKTVERHPSDLKKW